MRLAAFVTYLAAWFVIGGAALLNAFLRVRGPAAPLVMHAPLVIGTLLQFAGFLALTLSMPRDVPLALPVWHLAAVPMLAPLAAILCIWTIRSQDAGLVTWGAYGVVRHPLYLSFFLMLLATGLLVTTPAMLAGAALLYLAGSELRLASEERELLAAYPDYAAYQRRTRWRYLPGIR